MFYQIWFFITLPVVIIMTMILFAFGLLKYSIWIDTKNHRKRQELRRKRSEKQKLVLENQFKIS